MPLFSPKTPQNYLVWLTSRSKTGTHFLTYSRLALVGTERHVATCSSFLFWSPELDLLLSANKLTLTYIYSGLYQKTRKKMQTHLSSTLEQAHFHFWIWCLSKAQRGTLLVRAESHSRVVRKWIETQRTRSANITAIVLGSRLTKTSVS